MNYMNNVACRSLSACWIYALVYAATVVASAYGQVAIHGDHYYVMNNRRVRWEAAAAACRDDGGYLVSIPTQEEQTFVHAFHEVNTYDLRVWIGLKCELGTSCDGAHWEDGTALNYTAWYLNRKYTTTKNTVESNNCSKYVYYR